MSNDTVFNRFRKNRLASFGAKLVIALVLLALLAPLIANDKPLIFKHDGEWLFPIFEDVSHIQVDVMFRNWKKSHPADFVMMPPIPYSPTEYNLDETLQPPGMGHWLGTDEQGRDTLARLIYGTRISLSIGVVAVSIYLIIGIVLGALAGFYGGWVDMVISRLIEIVYCFPTFFLILAVLAFVGPSIYNIMIIIGLTGWTDSARLVRGEFLKLKSQDFVVASEALGASNFRLMLQHLLPNSMAPILVSATFGVASAILVESALSFLGFGVPPYVPSWGDILSQSREFMDIAWWLTFFPGAAIFITVVAYNLIGEGLRDAFDPHMRVSK